MRGFIPPQNQEETVFCKKACSLCEKTDKTGIKSFSSFLDLRQKELFRAQANKYPGLKVDFYAGYEGDSERCVACVCTEYDEVYDYEYPISVLVSSVNSEDKLTHRDFLGSLMGLMIKREYIGDIIVQDDVCYIVCHENMATIIISELKKVGRGGVSFEYYSGSLSYKRQVSASRSVTVASMRIDAVLGAVLNISRSESASLVKQGLVHINHLLVKRTDFEIMDKDVLSVRHHGKYLIGFEGTKSRKDRFFITYYKY